jgi:PPIC-type peptidyl-prolyl cis-trans isomerase-like protein
MRLATTLALALASAHAGVGRAAAQARPRQSPQSPQSPRIVAKIGDVAIGADTFASYVLDQCATTEKGASSLEALVQERMVEAEAARRGISVDDAAITARYQELDRKMREQSGGKQGMDDYLKTIRHLTPAEFRAVLGKSILAEKMMAEDFGLAPGTPVPPEKQGLWFRDGHRPAVKHDGLAPGVAADVGGLPVTRTEWGIRLFGALADSEQDELFKEFVGVELLLQRGRDLAIEVTAAMIREELDERTAQLKEMLAKQGMPNDSVDFLSTLKARGDDPDVFLKSDKFRAELLWKEIARQRYGKDGFKGYYQARRTDFDALFGRKVKVATIFLSAAMKKSAKVARTYAEASRELEGMRDRLASDPGALSAAFASQARLHSEDGRSARAGGELGFLGAKELEELGLPASLLDEPSGRLVGPVTAHDGVHLLLVGEKRDASPFEEIKGEVEKAARRNVLEELRKDVKVERFL